MKSLLVLLCVVALSQARTAVKAPETRDVTLIPGLGAYPWVAHIRVAVANSGFLHSCVGTFINHRWVLSSVACVGDARFLWVGLAVVNAPHPGLVIETNLVKEHDSGIALVDLNRHVDYTDHIKPADIAFRLWIPSDTVFCGFSNGSERMQCRDVKDGRIQVSKQDLGGGLIYGDTVYGVMVAEDEAEVIAWHRIWLQWETGILLRSAQSSAQDVIQE